MFLLLLVLTESVFRGILWNFCIFSVVFLWDRVSGAEFQIQNYKNRFQSMKDAKSVVVDVNICKKKLEKGSNKNWNHNIVVKRKKSVLYDTSGFACLRCVACGHCVFAESPCGRPELLNLTYFGNFFTLYKYCKQKLTNNFSYGSENIIF